MANMVDFAVTTTVPVVTPEIIAPPPGIYRNEPAQKYHLWPYMSSTFVKGFSQNPFAARFKPFKGSPSADLGSGSHAFTLEGREAFNREFYVIAEQCPEGQNPKSWKMTKAYKELYAEALLEAGARTVLDGTQWEAILGMDKSLREHPTSSQMLNRGVKEMSLVFVHPESGLTVKARLDDYFEGVGSDLKTSNDIEWFHRDIYNRKYSLQAALYSMACEANGLPVNYFCFYAAQTTETYPVRCGYIAPDKLEAAKCEVTRLLCLIKECLEQNYWPNFKLPTECYSIDQLNAAANLEEW